jgi:LacI family transcriptional regulator
MTSIIDVARKARVSVGTASNVLNGDPRVGRELRKRVLAAIKALDYAPNALARGLRIQRTHTLGLVIPDVTNPFFGELAKRVGEAADAIGCSVILGNSDDRRAVEATHLRMLATRRIDGLVLVPTPETRDLEPLRNIPSVVIDRPLRGWPSVATDHRAGAKAAVQHLVDLGHRRIGCIAGPDDLAVARERQKGYRLIVEERLSAKDGPIAEYVFVGRFDYDSGYEGAMQLLRRVRPTAIFASSDQQAIGALRAAADLGLRVPEDLSVAGFDAIPLAQHVTPRLTTVAQPIAAIAEKAVWLLGAVRDGAKFDMRYKLDATLQIGKSTGPAPRGAGAQRR